jgi:rhamnose utilization protein RhaD (predicted bifunctional aldolase and dehydrogenase)
MSTELKDTGISRDVAADNQAIMEHVITGLPLDPAIARRVQERARAIRQEILEKHGILNVAVDLIRESRDDV